MVKIFFFQKRNFGTGELLEEFVDCGERTAWNYYRKGRSFKYIGWSTGEFMIAVKKQIPRLGTDKNTGMVKQPTKKIKDLVREACDKELEFAKNNPDKTPPRDLTKGLGGTKLDAQTQKLIGRL